MNRTRQHSWRTTHVWFGGMEGTFAGKPAAGGGPFGGAGGAILTASISRRKYSGKLESFWEKRRERRNLAAQCWIEGSLGDRDLVLAMFTRPTFLVEAGTLQ